MKNLVICLFANLILISSSQGPDVIFSPDDSFFRNPERGFYHHFETAVTDDPNTSPTTVSPTTIQSYLDSESDFSLILRLYYLRQFLDVDISEPYLDSMQEDFNILREKGIKCVLRFAYSNSGTDPYGTAPKPVVLRHLEQLQHVLSNNIDVIAVIQAGFIGAWGEWYYTEHFGDAGNISGEQWTDREEVLREMLKILPPERMVQLRTPKFKRMFFGEEALTQENSHDGSDQSRVGHHNDCFLTRYNDYGTYENPSIEYPYLQQETTYTAMGGETCAKHPPRSKCPTALEELTMFHWSYLNADYNADVLNSWKSDGCYDLIRKKLGYRFELQSASASAEMTEVTITFDVANVGFANIYNSRPVYLVLINVDDATDRHEQLLTKADPLYWNPLEPQTVSETVVFSSIVDARTFNIYLWLPDISSPEVKADPRYAVRFANTNIYDASTGLHKLGITREILTWRTSPSGCPCWDNSDIDCACCLFDDEGVARGCQIGEDQPTVCVECFHGCPAELGRLSGGFLNQFLKPDAHACCNSCWRNVECSHWEYNVEEKVCSHYESTAVPDSTGQYPWVRSRM